MPGTLYLVATPIGNLEDITHRAVRILGEVDFIICEDTRHSGMLLKHLNISKPLKSFHDHSSPDKLAFLMRELEEGKSAAYISDAGTPLISDPGFELVREALKKEIRVEGIPGPSAFVNALVVSGLPSHEFVFVGYLPQKAKKRGDSLKALGDEGRTFIFYESPYRIMKALEAILEYCGDREVAVSREMTKKFEETIRGKVSDIIRRWKAKKMLGEFAVVVSGKGRDE